MIGFYFIFNNGREEVQHNTVDVSQVLQIIQKLEH